MIFFWCCFAVISKSETLFFQLLWIAKITILALVVALQWMTWWCNCLWNWTTNQPTGGAQSPSCLLFLFTLAVQENQQVLEMSQAECRETLHKLLPNVPLPDEQVCILIVLFFFCFLYTGYFKVRLVFVLLSPPRCSRTIRNGSWDLRGQ